MEGPPERPAGAVLTDHRRGQKKQGRPLPVGPCFLHPLSRMALWRGKLIERPARGSQQSLSITILIIGNVSNAYRAGWLQRGAVTAPQLRCRSVEAPIALTAFLLSPQLPAASGVACTLRAFAPFLVDVLRRGSAGPDPATRTGSSIVEEARLGRLPPSAVSTFLVIRIAHRSHPPA